MLRTQLTLAAFAVAVPSVVFGQAFMYTSQERSIYAQAGSDSASLSASDFLTFDQRVSRALGNTGAGSEQSSSLLEGSISLFGDLGTTVWGVTTNRARGVFDVSFTLTQATDIRFFYVVNAVWNFTIWTPSGSQVIATSTDLGGIYDDRVSHFAAGTYRLRADADVTNGQSGNITVEMTIIPAPASLTLAAGAGLVSCRRRRR
ncbi:MAG: hypothetical protein SFY96_11900 [Planctomycetota bacterium]|nr:hypothetical protein [Planctomycetota bacterium]